MQRNRRTPKPKLDGFVPMPKPKLGEYEQIPKRIESKKEGQILEILDPNFLRQKNKSIVALMVDKDKIIASRDEKKQLNKAYYNEKNRRKAVAAEIGSSIRQRSTPAAALSPPPIPTFTPTPVSSPLQYENDEDEFYNEEVSLPSSRSINYGHQNEEEPADVSPIIPDHFSPFAFEDLPQFQIGPPASNKQIKEDVSIVRSPDILDLIKEFNNMTIH